MFKSIRFLGPIIFTSVYLNDNSIIMNESSGSKRKFYEDDNEVVPIPGTIIPAPASEIQSLGANKIIDGISIRSTKSIENLFKSIRESTMNFKHDVVGFINQSYSNYNHKEREITSTISQLHSRSEDLLPNSLYILISIMAGSIVARSRKNIFAKFLYPSIGGILAFRYFLPQTYQNTTRFIYKLENDNIPSFTKQQDMVYEKSVDLANNINHNVEQGRVQFETRSKQLKKSIGEITGLNVDEEVSKK